MSITITITCPECEEDTEVNCTPSIPARINCRMEDSVPKTPASFEPNYCSNPNCNREFDEALLEEIAKDKAESDEDDYFDKED